MNERPHRPVERKSVPRRGVSTWPTMGVLPEDHALELVCGRFTYHSFERRLEQAKFPRHLFALILEKRHYASQKVFTAAASACERRNAYRLHVKHDSDNTPTYMFSSRRLDR